MSKLVVIVDESGIDEIQAEEDSYPIQNQESPAQRTRYPHWHSLDGIRNGGESHVYLKDLSRVVTNEWNFDLRGGQEALWNSFPIKDVWQARGTRSCGPLWKNVRHAR